MASFVTEKCDIHVTVLVPISLNQVRYKRHYLVQLYIIV